MNYLTQNLRYFTNYFAKRAEENKQRKVSKYEIYFEQIYKILSWGDITQTLIIFLICNFVFWIIVHWQIKFLCLFFSSFLVMFIWDSYFETRDLTLYETKYTEAFDELRMFTREIVLNLKILRKESPSSFCIGMCLICLSMSFVAKNISGYVVIYLTLLGIFFMPLGFKCLPEEYTQYILQMIISLGNARGVLAEEELIPFISEKDFDNKDADLDSLLTDRTVDSVSNSLVSGISGMPSYLDIAESQRDIEEEDLIPSQESRGKLSHTPGDLSSDSDSENRDINFDPSQFNADSSSEEENLLGKGLEFSSDFVDDSYKKSVPKAGLSGMLSNVASMGGALVANVLKSSVGTAPVERKNSSSDSEFEIINPEDLK
ncbi:hypothetical protein JTB14_019426 [Gonioctena quinquepunctata]|nr:hypothetical protein JTB14_019426 [Gonioctena quinquepunctata]